MPSRNLQYIKLTGRKGINQQTELASLEELADARNVWAPDGRIQQRPGYQGIVSLGSGILAQEFGQLPDGSGTGGTLISETAAGVFVVQAANPGTLVLNDWPVGAWWYIGFTSVLSGAWFLPVTAPNANVVNVKVEYWNGSAWTHLNVAEVNRTSNSRALTHLDSNADGALFRFAPPADWAARTVSTSASRFFLRFTIRENALDAAVTIGGVVGPPAGPPEQQETASQVRGAFPVQFVDGKRYFVLYTYTRTTSQEFFIEGHLMTDLSFGGATFAYQQIPSVDSLPPTVAVVPEFNEVFAAYNHRVYRAHVTGVRRASNLAADGFSANVEDNILFVGPGEPRDSTILAYEMEFPKASFITFFDGRLWVAGLEGDPFTVRWSVAQPYHKIWPSLSAEPLMEDDNSPITALAPFGEHLTVFKQDSVWQMIRDAGVLAATDNTHYTPIRYVAGVGCVAQGSVKQIRGVLLFLAEDGVYAFDGTPTAKKLSDRIQGFINRITPGRRAFAVAAHWRTKSLYLLSVSLDGSTNNNMVLVYDYKNDSWWAWDAIEAHFWLEDEASNDNERLYFVNADGEVFQLGVGNTDHGGTITAYLETQRIGDKDNQKRRMRTVSIMGMNTHRTVTTIARSNDDTVNQTTGSLTFTDTNEAVFGTAVWNTGTFTSQRRRRRTLMFRSSADWHQIRLSHADRGFPWDVELIEVGYIPQGKRT